MLFDLTPQGDELRDQIATVSCHHPEPDEGFGKEGFLEAEAIDGGADDRGQVGVVGLVARMRGLSEALVAKGSTMRTSNPAAAQARLGMR